MQSLNRFRINLSKKSPLMCGAPKREARDDIFQKCHMELAQPSQ